MQQFLRRHREKYFQTSRDLRSVDRLIARCSSCGDPKLHDERDIGCDGSLTKPLGRRCKTSGEGKIVYDAQPGNI